MTKSQITHLLIDLDGTLLGCHGRRMTYEIVTYSLFFMFLKHKTPWGIYKALKCTKLISEDMKNRGNGSTVEERAITITSSTFGIPYEEAKILFRESVEAVGSRLQKSFFLKADALAFLEWAKDHYKLILATNPVFPRVLVKTRMEWGGMTPDLFHSITYMDEMRWTKPYTEYYREILERHQLRAENCFMIGNEYPMDLPATEAGIPTFILSESAQAVEIDRLRMAPSWHGSFEALRQLLHTHS